MAPFGRSLVALGALIALVGLLLWGGSGIPWLGRLGRLPGDIYVQRGNSSFYFPLTSCIIASVVLSLLWVLVSAWMRR